MRHEPGGQFLLLLGVGDELAQRRGGGFEIAEWKQGALRPDQVDDGASPILHSLGFRSVIRERLAVGRLVRREARLDECRPVLEIRS
jgi:hypothetical protein